MEFELQARDIAEIHRHFATRAHQLIVDLFLDFRKMLLRLGPLLGRQCLDCAPGSSFERAFKNLSKLPRKDLGHRFGNLGARRLLVDDPAADDRVLRAPIIRGVGGATGQSKEESAGKGR